jgi:hypothetical protein
MNQGDRLLGWGLRLAKCGTSKNELGGEQAEGSRLSSHRRILLVDYLNRLPLNRALQPMWRTILAVVQMRRVAEKRCYCAATATIAL